ncbi:RMD1 family protein [Desulfitobacterium sp. Sab5]|uniref:RMD1 family protein n=1 Tax=Desulfitobacterium TaxID=36853 RepID=UPI003CF6415D
MEKIFFNTYKVAPRLPIIRIASFFNLKQDIGWKEYLKIDGAEVEQILKYASAEKAVYLYKYGCISFLNFNRDEITVFLDYLETLFVELDYQLISHYNESHALILSSEGEVYLWEGADHKFQDHQQMADIAAAVLAKSTELSSIETELSEVLDDADYFINQLKQGYLKANTHKVISTIAKNIRFKYRSLESVRLLDRPSEFNRIFKARQMYDALSGYYELDERYEIIFNQMEVLDSITGEYFSFRSKRSEKRLLIFEIVLLSLFPILHILSK